MEEKIIEEVSNVPKLPSKMQEKLKSLEKDWQSLSKTKPKLRKCTSIDNSNATSLKKQLMLVEKSPRELMLSLQHPTVLLSSPVSLNVSGEVWRVRENELAREEEARRERRNAAFGRGSLRGRRLFDGERDVGVDWGSEIGSVCTEEVCLGEGRAWNVEVVKNISEDNGKKEKCLSEGVGVKVCAYGRSLMVFTLFIVFTFMLLILIVFAAFDELRSGDQFLVPT